MTDLRSIFCTGRDEVSARLLTALKAGPTLLVGPPGTGKTSECFSAASSLGIKAYIAHCDPGALSDRYTGGYKPLAGVWDWVDGVILRAMREGAMLIVDDLHLMGPDGQAALYQACDFGPGSTFSLDDGTNVSPMPGYCVVATMNGDPSRLDEAVRSRFRNIIPALEPSSVMLGALMVGSDPTIGDLCGLDYEAGASRCGEYREWQALAANLSNGAPLPLAVGWAFMDGDGSVPSHYDRCQKVVKALHLAQYPGAADVMQRMAGQLPSGAPSMAIGA